MFQIEVYVLMVIVTKKIAIFHPDVGKLENTITWNIDWHNFACLLYKKGYLMFSDYVLHIHLDVL